MPTNGALHLFGACWAILLITISLTYGVGGQPATDAVWSACGNTTYRYHYDATFNDSFSKAEEYCKRAKGPSTVLAIPQSQEENGCLSDLRIRQGIGWNNWLGFKKDDASAAAMWMTVNGMPLTYTNWLRFPNNGLCAVMYRYENGTWNSIHCNSKRHVVCQRMSTCSYPANLVVASGTVKVNGSTGDILYSCMSNHSLEYTDGKTKAPVRSTAAVLSACLADGTWSVSGRIRCVYFACTYPTNPTLASGKFRVEHSTAEVVYSCMTNYTLEYVNGTTKSLVRRVGVVTSTCLSDGSWSVSGNIRCVSTCSYPAKLVLASGTAKVDGSTGDILYSCMSNHNLEYTDGITKSPVRSTAAVLSTCLTDGTWSVSGRIRCVYFNCTYPTVSTLASGTIHVEHSTGEVVYSCMTNYTLEYVNGTTKSLVRRVGVVTSTCLSDGSWSVSGNIRCVSTCSYPAKLVLASGTAKVDGSTGDILYSCMSNHNLEYTDGITKSTIRSTVAVLSTCLTDGTWSVSGRIRCVYFTCTYPTNPTLASGTIHVEHSTGEVVYSCMTNYTLEYVNGTTKSLVRRVGVVTSTCLSDGSWSVSGNIRCVNTNFCPLLRSPNNGQLMFSEERVLGSTVQFYCSDGFHFPDGQTQLSATCQATGTWSTYPPDCVIQDARCSPPQPLENGWTIPNKTMYALGDEVTFGCLSGLLLRPPQVSTICQDDGGWSAPTPTCTGNGTQPIDDTDTDDAPVGTIVGVACGIMVIIVVLIVLIWTCRKRRASKQGLRRSQSSQAQLLTQSPSKENSGYEITEPEEPGGQSHVPREMFRSPGRNAGFGKAKWSVSSMAGRIQETEALAQGEAFDDTTYDHLLLGEKPNPDLGHSTYDTLQRVPSDEPQGAGPYDALQRGPDRVSVSSFGGGGGGGRGGSGSGGDVFGQVYDTLQRHPRDGMANASVRGGVPPAVAPVGAGTSQVPGVSERDQNQYEMPLHPDFLSGTSAQPLKDFQGAYETVPTTPAMQTQDSLEFPTYDTVNRDGTREVQGPESAVYDTLNREGRREAQDPEAATYDTLDRAGTRGAEGDSMLNPQDAEYSTLGIAQEPLAEDAYDTLHSSRAAGARDPSDATRGAPVRRPSSDGDQAGLQTAEGEGYATVPVQGSGKVNQQSDDGDGDSETLDPTYDSLGMPSKSTNEEAIAGGQVYESVCTGSDSPLQQNGPPEEKQGMQPHGSISRRPAAILPADQTFSRRSIPTRLPKRAGTIAGLPLHRPLPQPFHLTTGLGEAISTNASSNYEVSDPILEPRSRPSSGRSQNHPPAVTPSKPPTNESTTNGDSTETCAHQDSVDALYESVDAALLSKSKRSAHMHSAHTSTTTDTAVYPSSSKPVGGAMDAEAPVPQEVYSVPDLTRKKMVRQQSAPLLLSPVAESANLPAAQEVAEEDENVDRAPPLVPMITSAKPSDDNPLVEDPYARPDLSRKTSVRKPHAVPAVAAPVDPPVTATMIDEVDEDDDIVPPLVPHIEDWPHAVPALAAPVDPPVTATMIDEVDEVNDIVPPLVRDSGAAGGYYDSHTGSGHPGKIEVRGESTPPPGDPVKLNVVVKENVSSSTGGAGPQDMLLSSSDDLTGVSVKRRASLFLLAPVIQGSTATRP